MVLERNEKVPQRNLIRLHALGNFRSEVALPKQSPEADAREYLLR